MYKPLVATLQALLILALLATVGCNRTLPPVESTSGQRGAYVGFHPIQHHEDLLSPEERDALNKRYGNAVIICRVDPGSPADRAGLHSWDILRRYNGEAIHSLENLEHAAESIKPGMRVALEVERNGMDLTIEALADPVPSNVSDSFQLDRNASFRRLLGADAQAHDNGT